MVVLFLYSILGFVLIPYLVQSNFTKIMKQNLNTSAYLSRVYFNPFTFEVELNNLLILDDKNKNLLYFKSFNTNLEFTKVFTGEIKLKHIMIDSLKTSVSIYENKKLNFSHILEHLNSKTKSKKDDSVKEKNKQMIFSLDKFLLSNARIVFEDQSKSKNFLLETKPFYFEINNFSTKKDTLANIKTNIEMIDTLKLSLNSTLQLAPIKLNGKINFDTIQLPKIYSYLQDDLKFKFAGQISKLSTKFLLKQNNDITFVDLNNTVLDISKINYQDKLVDLTVNDLNHTINSIKIIKNKTLKYDISDINLSIKETDFIDLKKDKNKHFVVKNTSITIDKFMSDFNNSSLITLSLYTPQSGFLNTSTKVALKPLNIESVVNLKDFTVIPYSEYIKDFINIDIKSTTINTQANIKLTSSLQNVTVNTILSDIDIFHSLKKQRLLKINTLDMKNIKYTNNNLYIENILLDDFTTNVKIDKNKNTNIDNITKKKNDKKKEVHSKKSNFQYYIKEIKLSNGKAGFSDHSLPLNFDTNIHNLNAKINDLSSQNKKTDIKMTGVVEKYGLANIEANTLLTNFKNDTDVSIDFQNLDVRSFSPYSGKFIGQKISDGRLWLNLNYHINNSQLQSTNNIKIKNLTLGEDVNSSEALSLPVGLAIALLEDSEGLIDLDVPVKGDMSQPQFELSGVIWKTIGNIITNIATAPFRFLGSLLGIDSDELGTVDFNFAQALILPPQKEKLDKLFEVLQKKKNLIIVLQPSYNKVNDTKYLQEKRFIQLITSKNKDQMIRKIYIQKFGQKEFDKAAVIYKKEKFLSFLSKKIKETIIISQDDLERLAALRVKNIKTYFLSHKLTLDRIQIKNNVFENKDNNTKELSLKLELNTKD